MNLTIKLATIRKALVPVVGIIAQAVSLGLVPAGRDLDIASAVVWLATAYGVYKIPNAPTPAPVPPAMTTEETAKFKSAL